MMRKTAPAGKICETCKKEVVCYYRRTGKSCNGKEWRRKPKA